MTPEELQARRSSIGASEAAAVLGVSPWKKPIDLWMEKVGLVELEDVETSRKRWGKLLERAVVEEAREVLEIPFTRNPEGPRRRTFRHPDLEYLTATPDGFRLRPSRTIRAFSVEAKTSRSGKGFGDPWTDEIPLYYKAQAIHQSIVLEVPVVYVPTLIGGSDFRMYVVEPTREQKEALLEALVDFWRLVETKTAPEEISSEYVRAIHPEDDGSEKVATPSEIALVQEYREVRYGRESYEEKEAELATKIQAAIADAKKLVGPGFRISFAKSKDGERTDWKLLAADLERMVRTAAELGVREGGVVLLPNGEAMGADEAIAFVRSMHTEARPGSRVFRPTFFEEEGENGNA